MEDSRMTNFIFSDRDNDKNEICKCCLNNFPKPKNSLNISHLYTNPYLIQFLLLLKIEFPRFIISTHRICRTI